MFSGIDAFRISCHPTLPTGCGLDMRRYSIRLPALGISNLQEKSAAWRFDNDSRIYALSVLMSCLSGCIYLGYLFRNPPDIDDALLPIFPALGMLAGFCSVNQALAALLGWLGTAWLVMVIFAWPITRSTTMLFTIRTGDGYTSRLWAEFIDHQAVQLSPSFIISNNSGQSYS
jgi:hypothetical protein